MALSYKDKQVIVAEVHAVAKQSISAALADFRTLPVADMTRLRVEARKSNVQLKVVRNNLAKLAVTNTDFECLKDKFIGPTLIAFSESEPGKAARLLRDFAKDNDKLVIKHLSVSGQSYGPEQLDAIASLPTKDEAIAKLMAVMKAPVEKFVRTLAAPTVKFVRTLDAVRVKKEETN